MKSNKLLKVLSLVTVIGLVGCSGSEGESSKAQDVNLSFNAFDELKIRLLDNTETNLREKLIGSISNDDVVEKIKAKQELIRRIDSQVSEKESHKKNQIEELKKINENLFVLKSSLLDMKNKLKNNKSSTGYDLETSENLLRTLGQIITESSSHYQKLLKGRDQIIIMLADAKKRKSELGGTDRFFEFFAGSYSEHVRNIEIQLENINKEMSDTDASHRKFKVQASELEFKISVRKKGIKEKNLTRINKLRNKKIVLSKKVESLMTKSEELELSNSKLEKEIVTMKSDVAQLYVDITRLNKEKNSLEDMKYLTEGMSSSAIKLRIIKSLQNGDVSIKDVVKGLVALHNESNDENRKSNDDMIAESTALAEMISTDSIENFKVNYEEILSNQNHDGVELTYNKDFYRVTDLSLNNRVQCYSGTIFFNLMNELSNNPFENTVVIFTSGHVLPGYIEQKDGRLVLKGIETTGSGKSIINYGETKNISGDIRVFDAKQFLLSELFKYDISDFENVYKQMLKSMERYGFKTDQFYGLELKGSGVVNSNQFNASNFVFGSSSAPSGDQSRAEFDEITNNDFRATPVIVEEHYTRDREDYSEEIFGCKSMKLILGNEQVVKTHVRCRNDYGKIVSLSSYRAKPVHNSASISYSINGEARKGYLMLSSQDFSVCKLTSNRGELSLSIDLAGSESKFYDVIHDQLPMFLTMAGAEMIPGQIEKLELIKSLKFETRNETIFNAMNIANDGISGKFLSSQDMNLSVGLDYNSYDVTNGNGCRFSAHKQSLSALPYSLRDIHTLEKGVQVRMYCAKLNSDSGVIRNVKIAVNCTVSKQ